MLDSSRRVTQGCTASGASSPRFMVDQVVEALRSAENRGVLRALMRQTSGSAGKYPSRMAVGAEELEVLRALSHQSPLTWSTSSRSGLLSTRGPCRTWRIPLGCRP